MLPRTGVELNTTSPWRLHRVRDGVEIAVGGPWEIVSRQSNDKSSRRRPAASCNLNSHRSLAVSGHSNSEWIRCVGHGVFAGGRAGALAGSMRIKVSRHLPTLLSRIRYSHTDSRIRFVQHVQIQRTDVGSKRTNVEWGPAVAALPVAVSIDTRAFERCGGACAEGLP